MPQLFPIIQPQTEARQAEGLPLCTEVAWDFHEGKPIFKRGNPVIVTGKEAVKVWIWKALKTERGRYEIYTRDYGNEVESLIGQTFTGELKAAEAARYVREALEIYPYITLINRITVGFDLGDLTISCHVHTIYGEVNVTV